MLVKKEVTGLKEDNDRIHRMYLLMQKEAFPGKQTPSNMNIVNDMKPLG